MGNEWQEVKRAKSKSRGSSTNLANGNLNKEPGDVALAKLDSEWNKDSQKPNGTISTSKGAFNSLEVEASPPSSPKASPSSSADSGKAAPAKKAPKPKKPKVKKISTQDIAAGIAEEDLQLVLNAFEEKYSSDEYAQLERVADYFLGTFREVDIPFNKTVLEQPIHQAAEVPIQDLSEKVIQQAIAFFQKKKPENLARFASSLVKLFFEELPETQSSKTQPRKAKVGLLITLALIFRSRPEILVKLSEELLANSSRYSAPARLPFFFWIVHQAASSNLGIGIAVWCRVILPQILGQDLPTVNSSSKSSSQPVQSLNSSQMDRALQYAEGCFLESEKSTSDPPRAKRLGPSAGDVKSHHALNLTENVLLESAEAGIDLQEGGENREPIVPGGALEAIASSCFPSSPKIQSVSVRNRLLKLYSALKDLYLAGLWRGHNKSSDAIRLILDLGNIAADEPSTSGQSNELADQAASLLIDLVHADPKGITTAWEQRHKHQIKGSAIILQSLTSYPSDLQLLLKNNLRRQLMLDTFRHLRDRHRGLLATGKSWQQNAARSAEESLLSLSQKIVTTKRQSTFFNSSLLVAIILLTIIFLLKQDLVQAMLGDLRVRFVGFERFMNKIEGGLDLAQEQTVQFSRTTIMPALENLREWLVKEYDAKLKPHVGDLSQTAVEQFHTFVQKATTFLQQK